MRDDNITITHVDPPYSQIVSIIMDEDKHANMYSLFTVLAKKGKLGVSEKQLFNDKFEVWPSDELIEAVIDANTGCYATINIECSMVIWLQRNVYKFIHTRESVRPVTLISDSTSSKYAELYELYSQDFLDTSMGIYKSRCHNWPSGIPGNPKVKASHIRILVEIINIMSEHHDMVKRLHEQISRDSANGVVQFRRHSDNNAL